MKKSFAVEKTDIEWKAQLSPEAYKVLRENGTEFPYSGEYDKHFEKGSYRCAACKTALFESQHKYNSGCGWPALFCILKTTAMACEG